MTHKLLMSKAPAAGGGVAVASNTTAHTVDAVLAVTLAKPSGTASGDVLVAIIATGGNAQRPLTPPSGWTRLSVDESRYDHVFVKQAGGSEPASYDFTADDTARFAAVLLRATGAHGDAEAVFSVDLDPPAVTPAWGSAATLWITTLRRRSASGIAAATPPTDFADNIYVVTAAAISGAALDVAYRVTTASSIDPDAWTAAIGTLQRVSTIAVRPA